MEPGRRRRYKEVAVFQKLHQFLDAWTLCLQKGVHDTGLDILVREVFHGLDKAAFSKFQLWQNMYFSFLLSAIGRGL